MRLSTRPRPTGAASVTLCVAHLQDIAFSAAHGLLGAAERERAQGIRHRQTCEQFVKTRALLRLLLAECTGKPPAALELVDADGEAPRLARNRWGLHFSVSHSYDRAALAVAPCPIGIDIERIDPSHDWEPIADILFHEEERQRLRQAAPEVRTGLFFETWTRKEAYLKGIGAGLRLDAASFHTMSPDGAVAGAVPASGDRWYTLPVHAPGGYAAALAIRGPALALRAVERAAESAVGDGPMPHAGPDEPIRDAGILCGSAGIPFRRIVLS
jgi:4'-phosphopantetheinyl transferase